MRKLIIPVLLSLILIGSCKKKEDPTPDNNNTSNNNNNNNNQSETGPVSLRLKINNRLNNKPITLNSENYTNEHGDNFSMSHFKYFVSNIKLKKSDGSWLEVTDSYYLYDASNGSDTSFVVLGTLPEGTYTAFQFSIGIDSSHNNGGPRVGMLDPNKAGDMYWAWVKDYKFLSIEGYYGAGHSGLVLDIVDDKNYKTFTFDSTTSNWSDIKTDQKGTMVIELNATIDEIFKTPTTIDFTTVNNVGGSPYAEILSKNYEDMFSLKSVGLK